VIAPAIDHPLDGLAILWRVGTSDLILIDSSKTPFSKPIDSQKARKAGLDRDPSKGWWVIPAKL